MRGAANINERHRILAERESFRQEKIRERLRHQLSQHDSTARFARVSIFRILRENLSRALQQTSTSIVTITSTLKNLISKMRLRLSKKNLSRNF